MCFIILISEISTSAPWIDKLCWNDMRIIHVIGGKQHSRNVTKHLCLSLFSGFSFLMQISNKILLLLFRHVSSHLRRNDEWQRKCDVKVKMSVTTTGCYSDLFVEKLMCMKIHKKFNHHPRKVDSTTLEREKSCRANRFKRAPPISPFFTSK